MATDYRQLRALAEAPSPGEPYGRKVLFREGGIELLLVSWAEDFFCAPHDHGAAGGVLTLYEGAFTERTYGWREGALVVISERTVLAPAVIDIAAGSIHDMKATGSGLALHLYQPAIGDMHVYDIAQRQTLTVSDACGAWIPRDSRLILAKKPWP